MKAFLNIALLACALIAGFLLRGCLSSSPGSAPQPSTEETSVEWTCSMHPQIRLPESVPCPLCGMDLIVADDSDVGENRIALNEDAQRLIGLEVTPVERRFVETEVRMVGKIAHDETRLADLTSRVEGWIERLYVDYTGVPVGRGEHMVDLYSPDLVTAQEVLLQAKRNFDASSSGGLLDSSRGATLEAAREKLRLLGITSEQVSEIEVRGTPSDHVTIYSPIGGIVLAKHANQGAHIRVGTPIYEIADLSQVWLILEAYERDLAWLHYGQPIEFETKAYPGEVFKGTISFIAPTLDSITRTVRVRANVVNEDGRLKPGMFARAAVHARVASGGRVMPGELAGKWICPMHPEIVKDELDACDLCGMDLVTTEAQGFASLEDAEPPLVVPTSAVLVTGKRGVVYVRVPDAEEPTFEGREILLGPRAGDHYLVLDGLAEGELVVTHGNFKIDSALQLAAKPSMMSRRAQDDEDARTFELDRPRIEAVDEGLQRYLARVFDAYGALHESLAGDDAETSLLAARALPEDAPEEVDGRLAKRWKQLGDTLLRAIRTQRTKEAIESQRVAFEDLSKALTAAIDEFGIVERRVVVTECPMAFDNRGARWLQADDAILNPYFGASMLRCGTVLSTLAEQRPRAEESEPETAPAEEVVQQEPEATNADPVEPNEEIEAYLARVFDTYNKVNRALVGDDPQGAREASNALPVNAPQSNRPDADWPGLRERLLTSFASQKNAEGIEDQRAAFEGLTKALTSAIEAFGVRDRSVFVTECPMAFDGRGARWLQADKQVLNPYFGASMLRCGTVLSTLAHSDDE